MKRKHLLWGLPALLLGVVVVVAVGCPRDDALRPKEPEPEKSADREVRHKEGLEPPEGPELKIKAVPARSKGDLEALGEIAEGEYRVHLIDVGTGLSILVQGHDFNLLFDGGSNDDYRGLTQTKSRSRLVAYLWAALGPSGPKRCRPEGDGWPAWSGNKESRLTTWSSPIPIWTTRASSTTC